MRFIKIVTAALLVAATPACAQPAPAPVATRNVDPALWVVKDADSTIYLLGTVHVLRPETVWRNPKLDAAIASADQLYLEIPISSQEEMLAAMLPLVTQYGLSPNKPLSSRLTPDEYKTLQEAALLGPEVLASLPVDLERVILRCTEAEPSERPESMEQLAHELSACRDHGTWTEPNSRSYWDERGKRLSQLLAQPVPANADTLAAS